MDIKIQTAWEHFEEQIEELTDLNIIVNNFFNTHTPEDMFEIPEDEIVNAYKAAIDALGVSLHVLEVIPNAYATAIAEEKNNALSEEEKQQKTKEFVDHYNMVVDATIQRMKETNDTYIPILKSIARAREIKL